MKRREFLKRSAVTAGAALLAGCYPVFIERYLVRFPLVRIPVPNLPAEFEGLRILHLTDIHYGALVPLFFVEKLTGKSLTIGADMIVCTGDYIHERRSTRQIDEVWPLLSELRAPMGVHSVLGNHDHWANTERSLFWMKKSGQGIRGKARRFEREGKALWIAGAGDLWEDDIAIDMLLEGIPEEECRIVLAHNPDSADGPFAERIDLMISGHTHGGQVNLPFIGAPVLPVQNKNYSWGLKKSTKGHPVFISKGVGWAIYPVRFNCFPEIPLLELRRA